VREHGDGGVYKVDAGTALLGLVAYRGARFGKKGRIGDMYANLKSTVGVSAQRECVVKVLGGSGSIVMIGSSR